MSNHEEEEAYNSASDEDFAPSALLVEGDDDAADSSSSEDEDRGLASTTIAKKQKNQHKDVGEDLDFDNSGDEATIQKGRRKKRKLDDGDDDEAGGEGGLVKTRAQRRAEIGARKPLQATGTSSLDVDALFAQMTAQIPTPAPVAEPVTEKATRDTMIPSTTDASATNTAASTTASTSPAATLPSNAAPTVTIKRAYTFAGETHTETRTVPADSEEARLYLSQQAASSSSGLNPSSTSTTINTAATKPPLRRPTKRKSIFAVDSPTDAAATTITKGPKLNTLEKSKLDWAQQVDREGLGEELSEARKAKGGYLGKLDFLGRMDLKREGEGRGGRG